MPIKVKIQPHGLEVAARDGEILSDVIQGAGVLLEAACGGEGTCGQCLVKIVQGRCDWPGSDLLSPRLVREGYVLSCRARVTGDLVVEVPETTEVIRGDFTPSLLPGAETALHGHLQPLAPKEAAEARPGRHCGIACDIGTTTVTLKLADLDTGRALETVAAYNDQMACGADVISRIIYAGKKGHLQELRNRVVGTLNGLLGPALALQGIAPDDVTCGVIAGNTTMTHLVLGMDPAPIRESTYVPVLKSVPLTPAGGLGLRIRPDAPILFAPSVGGWVGGDITAGLLCIPPREDRRVDLFIDIGTNGELVIRGDEWMIGCACSAGPAFEGVGIKCGMRAAPGAIEAVDIKAGGEVSCRVDGGGRPRGLCGSGLIELVSSLFTSGLLGRDGKLSENVPHDRLRARGKNRAFVVARAHETAGGHDIVITEQDIANIMRAKAAIYSACSLLLKNVGLSCNDIARVYVAGGFGCSLNIRKAILLGMFPDIAPERFQYLGNTSVQGACLALLSEEHRRRLDEIAKCMTYIDLSTEPGYMDEYTAALFLPHTDASLFPSVGKPRSFDAG